MGTCNNNNPKKNTKKKKHNSIFAVSKILHNSSSSAPNKKKTKKRKKLLPKWAEKKTAQAGPPLQKLLKKPPHSPFTTFLSPQAPASAKPGHACTPHASPGGEWALARGRLLPSPAPAEVVRTKAHWQQLLQCSVDRLTIPVQQDDRRREFAKLSNTINLD